MIDRYGAATAALCALAVLVWLDLLKAVFS
jgi:hypothetical protein